MKQRGSPSKLQMDWALNTWGGMPKRRRGYCPTAVHEIKRRREDRDERQKRLAAIAEPFKARSPLPAEPCAGPTTPDPKG